MKKTSITITIAAFAILGWSTQSQAAPLLTGGDAVDGWILPSAGDVIFAVGMGTTEATLQGVTFTTSSPQLSGVGSRYGATLSYPSPSANDTALATIGNRLAYTNGNMNLTMTTLTAGQTYQLDQLFTAGGYPARSMKVFVDGDGDGTVDATPIDTLNLSNPNHVFLLRTTATADITGTIRVQLTPFDNQGGGGFFADGTMLSAVVLSTISATAPQSSNDSRTIDEDTQVLLATDDFGTYSDPGSVPLAAVKISTLASAGSLEYDTTGAGAWAAVTVDQEISAADITAGRLRFSPVADGNGTPYATVGFRVGNGTDFSIPYTLTVNVTPINDYAPTAANQVLGIAQGGFRVLAAANFGFADADGNDTLQMVKVTALPAAGSLELSSVAVTLDQEITVADINAGNLRFTPEPTASGLAYATFDFNVSDGTFYSPTSATMTIDIVALSVVQSVSPIPFANSGTLVGAAVFGNAGTYDGIPFALWSPPFTSAVAFGSGVTAVANAPFSNIDANLGGVAGGQYRTAIYTSGNAPGRLTVSGLDSAQTYRFQIGFGDLRVGSYPYSVNASITLSNASAVTVPLATGAVTTADDYALLTVTVTGTTSIRLDLPTAANGVGPFIAGFSVHRLGTSTYDTWASANGASSDPAEDSNHNGVPNGVEYFMGATPGNPATLPALVDTAGTWSWTIPYDPAAAASYKFQSSDGLSIWADALPGEIQILTSPDRIQFTLPSGTGRKFCRLEVTPTP